MNDRKFENFAKTHKAIGHLAQKHKDHMFACVFEKDGKMFLGPEVEVPAGLQVKLWSGVII